MTEILTALPRWAKTMLDAARRKRWLERLRERGMQVGEDVLLRPDQVIDLAYCHLITIGNSCSFGPDVLMLAHDELAAPFLGAVRVGPIVLHESCHIGARAIILPGVEIGPRTIVAACSVVSRSLPPDSVCAGNPARPVSTLASYLGTHSSRIATAALFPYSEFGIVEALSPVQRAELVKAVSSGDTYITGGRSAELSGTSGTVRTPTRHHRPTPPAHISPVDLQPRP